MNTKQMELAQEIANNKELSREEARSLKAQIIAEDIEKLYEEVRKLKVTQLSEVNDQHIHRKLDSAQHELWQAWTYIEKNFAD